MFWSRVEAGVTQMLSKWVTSEPSALGRESSCSHNCMGIGGGGAFAQASQRCLETGHWACQI